MSSWSFLWVQIGGLRGRSGGRNAQEVRYNRAPLITDWPASSIECTGEHEGDTFIVSRILLFILRLSRIAFSGLRSAPI
jgi:hypothetical protein